MSTATEQPAYLETFGCRMETEEDHEHPGDCDWGFACATCGRWLGVERKPCPDHAPTDIPGLQQALCSQPPGTHPVTFFYADDAGYGAPCMYCAYDAIHAAHEGCEHSHHGRWRSWHLTTQVMHLGGRLGLWQGFTRCQWGGGCDGCQTGFHWGPRFWFLGIQKTTWRRWSRPSRWSMCNACAAGECGQAVCTTETCSCLCSTWAAPA